MKLLVFAHTPPPHHGQSYMVELMLDAFGGDHRKKAPSEKCGTGRSRGLVAGEPSEPPSHPENDDFASICCYHVDARFSADIRDMGRARWGKLFQVFRYSLVAIWCRFRYGVSTFYFAPAPPKWPALIRDWLVMLLCRPFFRHIIHHWHAVGLTDWLERDGSSASRWLTRRLLGKPSLSLALATANLRDPLWLETKRVEVIPNGIPDPFPDFVQTLLPRRQARLEMRRSLLQQYASGGDPPFEPNKDSRLFKVLYLGYCFREKGIFETLEAVGRLRVILQEQHHPLTVHLTVAGDFPVARDRAEFDGRVARSDLAGVVDYVGFVQGKEKRRLLGESDCLCFPTYYPLESFGLVVLEAMAAGLNVVATSWRALPEILPTDYVGFVPERDPQAIAGAICKLFVEDSLPLRTRYLERFSDAVHLRRLRDALLSVNDE